MVCRLAHSPSWLEVLDLFIRASNKLNLQNLFKLEWCVTIRMPMYTFRIINTFSCYQKQHFLCIRWVRPLVFLLPKSSVTTAVYRNTAFVLHLFFQSYIFSTKISSIWYVSSLVVKVILLRTPVLRLVPKRNSSSTRTVCPRS